MKKRISLFLALILIFQTMSVIMTSNVFARNSGGRFEESFDYARLKDGDNFPTVSNSTWNHNADGDYDAYSLWRSFASPKKIIRGTGNRYLELAHSGSASGVQKFGQVLFDDWDKKALFISGTITTLAEFSFNARFTSDAQVDIKTFSGGDIQKTSDVGLDLYYKNGKLYHGSTALANIEKNKWHTLSFIIDNESNKYYISVENIDDDATVVSFADDVVCEFTNKNSKTNSFALWLYSGSSLDLDEVALKAIPLEEISDYTGKEYTKADYINFKKQTFNYNIIESDFLKVNGRDLYNRRGEKVVLRGINLGNWLLQETWMCPIPIDNWAYWNTITTFEQRFGKEKADALIKLWEDTYLTEKDLDYIHELGMNIVRVPFWYRNFMDDEGNYRYDKNGNVDLTRLEWLVEECSKRGIYVMLDMHGIPGLQSNNHSTGRMNNCHVFDDTAEGEMYRQRAEDLWVEIAKRFAGNPTVVAYDLFNEPYNEMSRNSTTNRNVWNLYDRLYKAIRKVDPDHIISMEAVWEWNSLPNPSEYGWVNIWYQFHNYNYETNEIDNKIKDVNNHASWNVPSVVGEFRGGGIWNYTLNTYNKNNISWITWTYKGTQRGDAGPFDWYIYYSVGTGPENPDYDYNTTPRVDAQNDTYEEIWEKYSQVGTDDGFLKYSDLFHTLEPYTYYYTKSPVAKSNCTVTFNTNGGSDVSDLTLAVGSKLPKEDTVSSKNGALFAGWYKDSACTQKWDIDNDILTGDTVLYAGWLDEDALLYDISFKNITDNKAVININNIAYTTPDAVMVMALYDDNGNMLKAESKAIASSDKEVEFTTNFSYKYIKVFLLSDMQNINPLSEPVTAINTNTIKRSFFNAFTQDDGTPTTTYRIHR